MSTLYATVAAIDRDSRTQAIARRLNLNIVKVAWEDTGRDKDSCYGDNISDMTLQTRNRAMPVIRRPNFKDVTADRAVTDFQVPVGNERGQDLTTIPFKEYLQNIEKYVPDWSQQSSSMWDDRDETILCSSQACILPLNAGKVDFNVNLFNYQSTDDAAAVLVITVSAQGTSAQITSRGKQELYFNHNGRAKDFTATRLKDDRAARGVALEGAMTAEERAKNVLYIFQIPLKYPPLIRRAAAASISDEGWDSFAYSMMSMQKLGGGGYMPLSLGSGTSSAKIKACGPPGPGGFIRARGMDHAILGVGEDDHGAYRGVQGRKLERDPRFPIRCTIQYYHVTDEAEVSEAALEQIAEELDRAYISAQAIGSLVTTTTTRKTEPGPAPPAVTTPLATFV